MEAFEKLNGSSLWMGVILRLYEKSEYNNKNLVEMLSFLFDILLDRNNVFDLLKCYSTRNLEEIPIINVSKIQYLGVIEDILVKSKFDDEIAIVIDIISGLLNHAENKRIFKENGGLNFLFNVMLNFKSTANNFYTQTLTVFEQLITKFQYIKYLLVYPYYYLELKMSICSLKHSSIQISSRTKTSILSLSIFSVSCQFMSL